MNYFATAPLIAAIANFLLAFFVLYQAPGQTLNRVFFFFGLSVSIWTFGAFMMFQVEDAESALLWTRILHVGVILLPLTFFHLAMFISESRHIPPELPQLSGPVGTEHDVAARYLATQAGGIEDEGHLLQARERVHDALEECGRRSAEHRGERFARLDPGEAEPVVEES